MDSINSSYEFKGVYTALITPFREDKIDRKAFSELIKWQIEQQVQGLVIGGSTGEGTALSINEKLELIDLANIVSQGAVPIILGLTSNTTKEAVATIKLFKDQVNAFLISPTFYNKPMPSGIYSHFKIICEETEIPIIVYNIPSRCGVELSVDILLHIAELPNILAIKESSQALTKLVHIKHFNKKLTLLSGDDATTLGFYAMGGEGCISVISNILPNFWVQMYKNFVEGKVKRAQAINAECHPLIQALGAESNPIPVKYALSLLQRYVSPELRAPLFPPSANNKILIESAIVGIQKYMYEVV